MPKDASCVRFPVPSSPFPGSVYMLETANPEQRTANREPGNLTGRVFQRPVWWLGTPGRRRASGGRQCRGIVLLKNIHQHALVLAYEVVTFADEAVEIHGALVLQGPDGQ
jgi:hypothetical protein